MTINDSHLIWIDLEMTGLDVDNDYILEIATIVTDEDLHILDTGPVFAIHQSDEILAGMDTWNTEHHGSSGLVDRVRESTITVEEAERETLAFLANYVPPGRSPMCGNSICQDRRFLHCLMPTLERYFHYRHLDVSTLKLLAKRWAPSVYKGVNKHETHLALADIYDSIEELRHYREHFFKLQ